MGVRITKPEFNLREKLSELDKPSGIKGNELLRSETTQDARNLIGAGRKNKVINGAMEISQRGTSFSGITGNSGDTYTLDRFKIQMNSFDEAVVTISQDSSAPEDGDGGFKKSLKIECTTAESGVPSTSEHARLIYDGEAFDFTDIGFGTKNAKRVTISFWVKSNLTGLWGMNIWRGDANRSILKTYTINNPNTWEHKVIKLPPDPIGGVVNHDNGYGLRLNWGLATATNLATNSSTLEDSWHGFQQQYFYPYETRHRNLFHSTGNNFYLTGVQCEVNDVATEFEHRLYEEELSLCKRYYQQVGPASSSVMILHGAGNGTQRIRGMHQLIPEMRATPTVTADTSSENFTFYSYAASPPSYSSVNGFSGTTKNIHWDFNTSTHNQAGDAFDVKGSGARLQINAEL